MADQEQGSARDHAPGADAGSLAADIFRHAITGEVVAWDGAEDDYGDMICRPATIEEEHEFTYYEARAFGGMH